MPINRKRPQQHDEVPESEGMLDDEALDELEDGNRVPVSPMEFIKAHEEATSLHDLCQRTGMTMGAMQSRINSYKRKGIKLKRFEGKGKKASLDVEAINQYLAELRGETKQPKAIGNGRKPTSTKQPASRDTRKPTPLTKPQPRKPSPRRRVLNDEEE